MQQRCWVAPCGCTCTASAHTSCGSIAWLQLIHQGGPPAPLEEQIQMFSQWRGAPSLLQRWLFDDKSANHCAAEYFRKSRTDRPIMQLSYFGLSSSFSWCQCKRGTGCTGTGQLPDRCAQHGRWVLPGAVCRSGGSLLGAGRYSLVHGQCWDQGGHRVQTAVGWMVPWGTVQKQRAGGWPGRG